jgi:hypothetical protein
VRITLDNQRNVHKLATWAEGDPNRRFDHLLRLMADRAWLAEAAGALN